MSTEMNEKQQEPEGQGVAEAAGLDQEDHEADARPSRAPPAPPANPAPLITTQRYHRLRDRAARLTDPRLVCNPQGLPVAFALTGAKADERETLLDLLAADPGLVADRPAQTLIGDKNYYGRGSDL